MAIYEIWSHYQSGERYLIENDHRDMIAGAIGPLHYKDLLDALIANSIESDPELVAELRTNREDYFRIDPRALRRNGETHLSLALAVRTDDWMIATSTVASRCATPTIADDGTDVLQDWLSHGDWSTIPSPEAIAAEWDALEGNTQ